MFSKAKTGKNAETKDAAAARQDATAASPSPIKRSGTPRASNVPSIISQDVVMRGNINSAGEIQFDGALEGDIKAGSLIVGDRASVKGEIVCDTIVVRGAVEGAIRAKSVSLASTARIQGDILHSSLSVETGAHFEGNCRHSDDPLSDSSAKDFRRARPSAPPPAPRPVNTANEEELQKSANGNANAPSFLSQNRSPLR